jgi:signal transduction histidine kinase
MIAPIVGQRRRDAKALPSETSALGTARSRANHRIAFLGHLLVFGGMLPFLLIVAGFLPTVIVAFAWGTLLVAHGWFFVIAPPLRDRLIAAEIEQHVESSVAKERRALGGEHARAMHRLSASVAHEIRNPITAARSLVQQIGEDPCSPKNEEYARVAVEELDRVERSIASLLRFAREEELSMTDVRLAAVVDSALSSLRDRLDGVDVRREHAADDALQGDAEALRRVVVNLVTNAIDAIAERVPAHPRIWISTGHDLAGTEVWLRVRDNGIGIDAEEADAIFDPLRTGKEHGTGIGLAVTRKLVEAHGGRVEVVLGLAEGSELLVTLPKAVAT